MRYSEALQFYLEEHFSKIVPQLVEAFFCSGDFLPVSAIVLTT